MALDRGGSERTSGGASLPTQLAAATTPYRSALAHRRLAVLDGAVRLPSGLRDAVVLVALRVALTDQQVVVHSRVGSVTLAPVTFVAFSDVDTWLPVLVPDDAVSGRDLLLDVLRTSGEHALAARVPTASDRVPDDAVTDLLEVLVVEGVMGRVLLLAETEKQRLRRDARALAAGTELRFATRSQLDLFGADRGVPRRHDGQEPEPDASYRARLAAYAELLAVTPARLAGLLDGPGAATDRGAGLPSLVGVTSRFEITEGTADVDLGLALVMVGPTGTAAATARTVAADALTDLHRGLDEHRLVPVGGALPAGRVLPAGERSRLGALATRLADRLDTSALAGRAWLSPQTAQCLDLALRTLGALGVDAPLGLLAAHAPDRDARFSLGLVVALRPLASGVLAAAASAAADVAGRAARARTADSDVAGVLAALDPADAATDPHGAWLWRACGLRTVLDDGGELLLSPLPVGRIVVTVASALAPGDQVTATAQFRSLRGSGRDARTDDALAELAAACARRAVPDLSGAVLDPAAAEAALTARAADRGADTLPGEISGVKLPWGAVAGATAAALAAQLLGAELPETVVVGLAPAQLTAGVVETLAAGWAAALGDCGFVSVRGLWDPAAGRVLLVATLTRILGPGTGAARAATYRWRAAATSRTVERSPLDVTGSARGPAANLVARAPGPALLVVAVPRRSGSAEPYQVAVTLPGGAAGPQLDAEQYGYVMNLLEQAYPVGVEVSTYDLRRNHVDVDSDGRPDFLTSAASRTYLRSRRRRPTGARVLTTAQEQENDHG